jgi:hypothetical protein
LTAAANQTRTYADFSEELIRKPDGTASCPFFIDDSLSSRSLDPH